MSTLYIVVLTYIEPLEEVGDAIPAHVEWLKKGYTDGLFLASGRCPPRTGGVIPVKCVSRKTPESHLSQDLFQQLGLARTETIPFEASMASPIPQSLLQAYPGGKMQPSFHWINEPAEWRRDTNGLTVVTDGYTDFRCHTRYGFERFSGYLYATEAEGDFTLQAKICANFTTLYDQAGLVVMADEQTWLKAGTEFNDDAPAIGSALTLTHSDWATGLFPDDPRTFQLRLTRKGDALRLQHSTDGERWPLLRLDYFPPDPVKAGVMCYSPECGGLAVAFQDIQLSPPSDKALHDLN